MVGVRLPHRPHDHVRKLACCPTLVFFAAVTLLSVVSTGAWSTTPATPAYWCPDRSADQLYSADPEPGCVPLVEQKELDAITPRPPLKSEIFVSDVSRFLERYRWFLDCCATDVTSIEEAENLKRHAHGLLRAIEPDLFLYLKRVRGVTLTVLMTPVARARDDLRRITQQLEERRAAEARLATLDFYSAWRERRRLRDELESFVQRAQRPRLPAGLPTGMDIGVTPLRGPEIGVVPPTGPEIGTVPPTGPEIGITPPTGKEIGQTPPTGFEIGTTGQVGPDVGGSNQQR